MRALLNTLALIGVFAGSASATAEAAEIGQQVAARARAAWHKVPAPLRNRAAAVARSPVTRELLARGTLLTAGAALTYGGIRTSLAGQHDLGSGMVIAGIGMGVQSASLGPMSRGRLMRAVGTGIAAGISGPLFMKVSALLESPATDPAVLLASVPAATALGLVHGTALYTGAANGLGAWK